MLSNESRQRIVNYVKHRNALSLDHTRYFIICLLCAYENGIRSIEADYLLNDNLTKFLECYEEANKSGIKLKEGLEKLS